jgi:prepilin-type N-terminal cleavage/methylation domain-containing protein
MKHSSAFTLVELLVTIAIMGIIILPMYFSYTRTQANQGLRATSEQLISNIKQAHVFAREAKDQKSWGVKRGSDDTSYELIAGTCGTTNYTRIQTKSAEPLVKFPQDFFVCFEIGTGEPVAETTIVVENKYGITKSLKVYKTGLVEEIQ